MANLQAPTTAPTVPSTTAAPAVSAPVYSIKDVQGWESDFYVQQKREAFTKTLETIGLGDRVKAVTDSDAYKNGSPTDQTKMLIEDFKTALRTDSRLTSMVTSMDTGMGFPFSKFLDDKSGQINETTMGALNPFVLARATNSGSPGQTALASIGQSLKDEKSYGAIAAGYDALSKMFVEPAAQLEKQGGMNTEQRVQSLLGNLRDRLNQVPSLLALQPKEIQDFAQSTGTPSLTAGALAAMKDFKNTNSMPGGFLVDQGAALDADFNKIGDQIVASRPTTAQQQGWEKDFYTKNQEADLEKVYSSLGISSRIDAIKDFKTKPVEEKVAALVNDLAVYANAQPLANVLGVGPLKDFVTDNAAYPGKVTDKLIIALDNLASTVAKDPKTAFAAVGGLRADFASEKEYGGEKAALSVLSQLLPAETAKLEQDGKVTNTIDKVNSLLASLQTKLKDTSYKTAPGGASWLDVSSPTLTGGAIAAIEWQMGDVGMSSNTFADEIATMRNTRG